VLTESIASFGGVLKSVRQYSSSIYLYIMTAMEFLVGTRSASGCATTRLSFQTLRTGIYGSRNLESLHGK
jgi:hypothetical protein